MQILLHRLQGANNIRDFATTLANHAAKFPTRTKQLEGDLLSSMKACITAFVQQRTGTQAEETALTLATAPFEATPDDIVRKILSTIGSVKEVAPLEVVQKRWQSVSFLFCQIRQYSTRTVHPQYRLHSRRVMRKRVRQMIAFEVFEKCARPTPLTVPGQKRPSCTEGLDTAKNGPSWKEWNVGALGDGAFPGVFVGFFFARVCLSSFCCPSNPSHGFRFLFLKKQKTGRKHKSPNRFRHPPILHRHDVAPVSAAFPSCHAKEGATDDRFRGL